MIQVIKALFFALTHPRPIQLVVLRRYVDAKGHFIGELYMDGKMIGMSCDSLIYRIGALPEGIAANICGAVDATHEFTDPMGLNVVRVGGMTPDETLKVRADMRLRRYCRIHWSFHNRFIEHVLEKDIVR